MFKISDSDYKELWTWTRRYIAEVCIVRGDMPAKAPGKRYSWMFYLRRGLFDHEFLSAVSQMFYYKMDREDIGDFQITGLETAATPMLAGIPLVGRALGRDLNSFVVRKERKEYGLENIIEGVPLDKQCVIIDDLCNSTTSMRRCYDVLQQEQLQVSDFAFAIVNKSIIGQHDYQRLNGDMYLPPHIKVVSLFNLTDFNLYATSH